MEPISTLFLDIGGVLLTNGWDRAARQKAAQVFNLDYQEMDERHHLTFDTYEEGKLSLDEYLTRLVFYQDRSFSRDDFKSFMYGRSKPYSEMINLVRALKAQYGLKVAAISNEGRELTEYRIREFQLDRFIDFFISSCFVHFRKPDADIYRIALDVAQVQPPNAIYIDDRPMFVDVASDLNIRTIWHKDFSSTRDRLVDFGLFIPERKDIPV